MQTPSRTESIPTHSDGTKAKDLGIYVPNQVVHELYILMIAVLQRSCTAASKAAVH